MWKLPVSTQTNSVTDMYKTASVSKWEYQKQNSAKIGTDHLSHLYQQVSHPFLQQVHTGYVIIAAGSLLIGNKTGQLFIRQLESFTPGYPMMSCQSCHNLILLGLQVLIIYMCMYKKDKNTCTCIYTWI